MSGHALFGRHAVAGPDDSVFVRIDGDLDTIPQPELGQDVRDVAFDGRLAEVEPDGDLGVRHTLGDQPDDAEFACAERAWKMTTRDA